MGRVPRRGENRLLIDAVLASIVIHGMILLTFAGPRAPAGKTPVAPKPIAVRLAAPAADVPPVAPGRIEAPPNAVAAAVPAEAAPVPAPAKPRPARLPARKEFAAPSAAPENRTADAAAAPDAPETSGARVPPGPLAGSDPRRATPAPPAAATDDDQASLAAFRAEIIGAARRFKRYPRMALENNWEGTAKVRITFSAQGKRASIIIAQSSGHEVLDRQAIDMIAKAFVPLPSALRGREFAIDIPVIYDLKDY